MRRLAALERELSTFLASDPTAFPWFRETGPPHRAKLFRLAGTTYWIVFTVDERQRRVVIERFWNTARRPMSHGLRADPS
jgi:hypothetical protein